MDSEKRKEQKRQWKLDNPDKVKKCAHEYYLKHKNDFYRRRDKYRAKLKKKSSGTLPPSLWERIVKLIRSVLKLE